MADIDDAIASAKKIMGDKIKVPKAGPAVDKSGDEVSKAFAKFDKTRKSLEADILELQKALSNQGLALKQYGEQIAKSDFGADTKDADYKKKRADAQKGFDSLFGATDKTMQTNIKNCDELDKHLMDISSYKAPKDADI